MISQRRGDQRTGRHSVLLWCHAFSLPNTHKQRATRIDAERRYNWQNETTYWRHSMMMTHLSRSSAWMNERKDEGSDHSCFHGCDLLYFLRISDFDLWARVCSSMVRSNVAQSCADRRLRITKEGTNYHSGWEFLGTRRDSNGIKNDVVKCHPLVCWSLRCVMGTRRDSNGIQNIYTVVTKRHPIQFSTR